MFQKLCLVFYSLFIGQFLTGCAGPTTPFGPLGSEANRSDPLFYDKPNPHAQPRNAHFLPKLQISPDRQVLHDRADITILIEDRDGFSAGSRLDLHFNGRLIRSTSQFLIPPGSSRKALVSFRDIYLRADRTNRIEFFYQSRPRSAKVKHDLTPPDCLLNAQWPIHQNSKFRVSASILEEIQAQAKSKGINPALLYGLIAQESGFDPRAISWAKALGLTQVTPIADRQLKKTYPDWPRDRRIGELPVPVLKMMLASQKIQNDWRLDPKLSISGGLALLKEMSTYWLKKPMPIVLEKSDSPPSLEDLTLASYNSGALRVYEAIQEKGLSYLQHRDLREAKKYVNRVKSHCYHISRGSRVRVASR